MSDETTSETCPLCLTRPAEPGACATCAAGTMGMINDLASERDALLHALARCEAIALDECRTDAQVRGDVADTAAEAYAPHLARVRELARAPLPAHIRAGFRGELATAEGLHAAERARLLAALRRYGLCDDECPRWADRGAACTCGYAAALADAAREGAR